MLSCIAFSAILAVFSVNASEVAVQVDECSVVEETYSGPNSIKRLDFTCLLSFRNQDAILNQIKGPEVKSLSLKMGAGVLNFVYKDFCFSQLPNLSVLRILAPYPFHISSKALYGLQSLKDLIINENFHIRVVSDDDLKTYHRWGATNLTREDLNWTSPSFSPGWLNSVPNLRLLTIVLSNISSFRPGEFCQLLHLETLNICSNIINSTEQLGIMCRLSEQCIPCLPSLEKLCLDNNPIASLDINFSKDLPKLRVLKASSCRISSLPYNADGLLSACMEAIDLSNNQLSSLHVVNQSQCSNTQLRILNLGNNTLRSLSQGLFRCIGGLKQLGLNSNYLSYDILVSASLNSLMQLEYLDLSNNRHVSKLQSMLLGNLSKLQVFRCTDCSLKFIEDDTFLTLKNLQVLELRRNYLVDLDSVTGLPSLERLYLDQNLLPRFPNFSSASNLSILDIDQNRIKRLEPLRMTGLINLRRLSLAFNEICNIPYNAFFSMSKLEKLFLNNNDIKTIEYRAFNGLSNLLSLRLDNNALKEMKAIKGSVITSLRQLNNSKNSITTVGYVIMENIEWFDFSWNQISEINYDFLSGSRLKFANFSHNNLRFFHQSLLYTSVYPRPELLLAGNPLHCDCKMEWLKFTKIDKPLSEIAMRLWRTWAKKPKIYKHMSDPIKGDPSLFTMYFIKVPDLEMVRCSTVATGMNSSFASLKAEDFVCPYETECNNWNCEPGCCDEEMCNCRGFCFPQCSCYSKHDHSVNYMYCTSRNISVLPIQRPIYAKDIYLDGNNLNQVNSTNLNFPHLENLALNNSHITQIHPGTFKNLKVLKVLDLHGNDLRQINESIFIGELTLKALYLQENQIGVIENGSFKHLHFIQTLWLHSNNLRYINLTIFDSFDNLTDLSLHDNLWQCDCHFGPIFQKWLISKFDILKNSKHIHCEEYIQNGSMELDDDDAKQFSAGQLLSHARRTKSLLHIDFSLCNNASVTIVHIEHNGTKNLIFLTIAFVVVAVALLVIYKNRLLIRIWAYNRYGVRFSKAESDIEKPYDIFLTYSKDLQDECLVLLDLLPKLEDDPNMSYRVCLECRDWDPLGGKAEKIITSIQKSKRTIILVSEGYFETQWCEYTFDAAHFQVLNDKQRRLILILTDKELEARMDRNMKLYMKTNASLVWGEKWFWEKLRYYLANNPCGADYIAGREFKLLKGYKEGTAKSPTIITGGSL